MKVVFLIRSLETGGAERQLIYLASGLKKEGVSVTICVFYCGGELEQMLNNSGVSIKCLNKKNRWDVIGFFLRTVTWLRHESPDVLHSYLTGANIVSIMLKPFLSKLTIVWGVRASNMRLENYDRLARQSFRLSAMLAKYADYIIVNSSSGYDYHLSQGYPPNRMTVIPNGIDTQLFTPNYYFRHEQRKQWRISNKLKLVGIVGRIDPMKDHKAFLKAAQMVLLEKRDVVFICVGNGNSRYIEDLRNYSEKLGIASNIIWKPAVTNIEYVYNALDVLVSTSAFGEGFSNTLAEAMACGVPCVATDVGDAKKILLNEDMIVPLRNSTLIAKKIIEIISHTILEDDCKQGRVEYIRNNYSIDKMVSNTMQVLKL